MSGNSVNGQVIDVPPHLLREWLAAGSAKLIDVREDFEHAAESIPAAQSHPLSAFEADQLRAAAGGDRLVFCCRTGKRSAEAARRFRQGDELTFHLTGGLEGWQAAGYPVRRTDAGPRIGIMRQVQIIAGSLVLVGVIAGASWSPWCFLLSGMVGGGLVFAGISGWCGMAKLLVRMPWNRSAMPRPDGSSPGSDAAPASVGKASCCVAD